MKPAILAMAAMLAALILGSGVALAFSAAGPAERSGSSTGASSCNPRVIDLGTLGGPYSEAIEVNDSEWVVGGADTRNEGSHPALWRSGNVRDLGALNFRDDEALSINERGTIVGTLYNGDPFGENGEPARARGFVWREGEMKRLPTLGDSFSYARRVNEQGVVAGSATKPNGNERDVIWRNGRPKNLGTLGGDFSFGLGMNDLGQVVGVSDTSRKEPYHPRGFVWSGGVLLGLPTLGGDFGNAHGTNNQGTIAGHSDLPSGKSHATLYRCALGFAPNAYKAQQVSVSSSSASSFGAESTADSELVPGLDRLTPQLAPARQQVSKRKH